MSRCVKRLAKPVGFAQIASIPIGYNNPRLVRALVNRPVLGNFPSTEWLSTLQDGIFKAAPRGFDQVFTGMSGSDANEAAFKAACMWKAQIDRGGATIPIPEKETRSAMMNKPPGSPNYSILSFEGRFHSRLFLDVPAFNWPCAPFPKLRYPLHTHGEGNAKEEARCLQAVDVIIKSFHNPIAAIIVEPIRRRQPRLPIVLPKLTCHHNKPQRALHRRRGPNRHRRNRRDMGSRPLEPHRTPDIVTFSKKAQTAEYHFHDAALRPNKPYRRFNTWMGDPSKAIMMRAIVREIEERDLVAKTMHTGTYLFDALERLSGKFPTEILNLRGKDRGTFITFDSPRRDEVVRMCKQRGVNVGGSGERAVRLRPMLTFEQYHADVLLETLESVLKT